VSDEKRLWAPWIDGSVTARTVSPATLRIRPDRWRGVTRQPASGSADEDHDPAGHHRLNDRDRGEGERGDVQQARGGGDRQTGDESPRGEQ